MKNMNTRSRVLAWLLCGALMLPLAACKKDSGESNSGDASQTETAASSESVPSVETDAAGRPLYVAESEPYFSSTEVEFAMPQGEEYADIKVYATTFWKDCVLLRYNVSRELSEAEQEEMDQLNCNKQGDLLRYYELQYSTSEEGILICDMNGQLVEQIKFDLYESWVGTLTKDDQEFGVVLNEFNPMQQSTHTKVVFLNEKGERIHEMSSEVLDCCMEYLALDNGNFLTTSYSVNGVLLIDPKGKQIGCGLCDNELVNLIRIDGDIYLISKQSDYDFDGIDKSKYFLQKVDPETAKLGNATEIKNPTHSSWIESNGVIIKLMDGSGITQCDLLQGTEEVMVNFDYTDVSTPYNLADIKVSADQREVCYLTNVTSGTGETSTVKGHMTKLHREEKNPHAGKRVIYVATCEGDTKFEQLLTDYNASPNSKTRVRMYLPEGDTGLPYDKMRNDMADQILLSMKSGSGPDILLNCAAYSQFNTERVLVDLNTYLDGPQGIDRSLYFDNVFRAFEMNGKLYQMPLAVSVGGFVGNPATLGEMEDWTPEIFEQKIDALGPAIYPIMGYSNRLNFANLAVTDQTGILLELLYHDMNHYVDFDQNVAHFDSPDFIRLLDIAKKYGGRISADKERALMEEYDSWGYHSSNSLMMEDGVCALDTFGADALWSFAMYADLCSNHPLFLGWPTSAGKGISAEAMISVGISAFSECKEEAWDFILFMLQPSTLDRFASVDTRGVWVARSSAQKAFDAEIADYNRKVELFRNEPGRIESEAVCNQENAERFIQLIERVSGSVQTNPVIMDIVLEEAPAYFDGSKSAEQVSKTIQERVTILMEEMV